MYQNPEWREYDMELEPSVRKAILERMLAQYPSQEEGEIRALLFRLRHEDPARPGKEVDRMLWQCVNFSEMYGLFYLSGKKAADEILSSLRSLGLEEAVGAGAVGEAAFYQEARNGVRRYLKTCEHAGYHRKIFGLISSGKENRSRQIASDIWRMSEGVAGRFGLEEELRLWIRAVIDEYIARFPSECGYLEEIRSEEQKKRRSKNR